MAFTIEQIEEALVRDNTFILQRIDTFRATPSYPIITSYLTGSSTTLPAIPYQSGMYYWNGLVNLLNLSDAPSVNDQLVLDIVHHPDIAHTLEIHYIRRLDAHLFKHRDVSSLQLLITALKRSGLNDNAAFEYILFVTAQGVQDISELKGTPILQYLAENVKKKNNLIDYKIGMHEAWSILYFQLLEQEQPAMANGYVMTAIMVKNPDVIKYLMTHQNGKYANELLNTILKTELDDKTAFGVFQAAINIYELDPAKFKSVVILMSIKYLDYYYPKSSHLYEGGWQMDALGKAGIKYPSYSICALYYLFKYEPAIAIERYQQLVDKKERLHNNLLLLVHYFLQKNALTFLKPAILNDVAGQEFTQTAFGLLTAYFEPSIYLPVLWTAVASKSKTMRELVADTLANEDPEAEAKAIALLDHKKAAARQTAATILSYFKSATAQEAISKVLNKETNESARDMLLGAVSDTTDISAMVAAARNRGKLDQPVENWLTETELPELFYSNGAQLDADTVRFIFYRMSRVKGIATDAEARVILHQLDREKNTPFAKKILKLFLEKEAKPEHKYLLTLAAMMGNDEIVDKLRTTTNSWIEVNRIRMAEYGVGALALQGSNKALRWVEWYSRKYRSKKTVIGIAAAQALEAAATELNITPYELGDRIVPDFGFDGLFREFTVKEDTYRAFIDSDFKLVFFNDYNKKLKSIPADADAELKEEFKAIAKEVKDVVKSQSSRLEHFLVGQRRWTGEQWKSSFLENPIMFIYATRILWGIYDMNDNLQQCFLCGEDTTLTDLHDEELEIPDVADVAIVHPLQLNDTLLKQWEKKLYDLSIVPVFPQINRPVYHLAAEDKGKTIIRSFDRKAMEPGSIKSTLDHYGWRKGPGMDAGAIPYFHKEDHDGKIMAVVETEGIFATGYDTDIDPRIGRVYFIDIARENARWFDAPKSDKDVRLIPLERVPAVFYSEVMSGINAIQARKL